MVGRAGVDAFISILPGSALTHSWRLAEAALDAIEAPFGTRKLRVTASAGIGHALGGSGHQAFSRAVQAVCRAKLEGGGRVRARVY